MVEIVRLQKINEWWHAQLAVDGALSPPFEFHDATFRTFLDDYELKAYLTRQAKSLIEQFGDARSERIMEESECRDDPAALADSSHFNFPMPARA